MSAIQVELGLVAPALGEQGIWDAILQTMTELRLTDDWQYMIDSTGVRCQAGKGNSSSGPKL